MIGRCLESVRDDVDEMVVLDMQSRDSTRAIAEDLGARVSAVPITRKFDGVRQRGVELLSTDWVFQLDADEWAPNVIPELEKLGHLEHERAVAFPRMNYLGDRWIVRNAWWPNYQVRMFRRDRGYYTDGFHRFLVTEGEPVRLPRDPRFAIRHAGHEDASAMIESVARYVPDSTPLTLKDMMMLTARPLGAFVVSRGWKDGSDGFAILIAKLINSLAVASDGNQTEDSAPSR